MSGGHAERGAGRPLRRDAERNRRRILTAAREVFAARGLGATLDDVAQRAGLGVGTVYRRFSDKASLVDALFHDRIDDLVALAETALSEPDSWRGFTTFMERSSELLTDDIGLRDVVLGSTAGGKSVANARERLDPVLLRLLRRAQDDGHLRPDVRPVDVLMLNLMIGSVVDYTDHVRSGAWRRYLAVLIDGLRAGARTSPLPDALADADVEAAMRTWSTKRP
ncbi:helix-turn-helix transcriptional regulator [Saccharopolyspora sp. HNM0983]|uniref:Helix-turn-helix transcriptional regulator n=1 Tax=Saccharopolyspora montiporae TaxID=2781240 RepID=A0A929B7N0_9PSEU|nr:TetR/AcrR family transcriptional regulator [Saccharopolyspora sp. HNM0983]MBE9373330.1 helix-turn-helix transcriptional regulator [Saccharopolyspora sp. HNM0983]